MLFGKAELLLGPLLSIARLRIIYQLFELKGQLCWFGIVEKLAGVTWKTFLPSTYQAI